ncbi:MAG: murein L,D-transpeptidase catalytic domain family protein [Myxococcales bacterium]|nr:murein L,D-transpeptidase catalytic domain family protein [Myxococcales bacterium]
MLTYSLTLVALPPSPTTSALWDTSLEQAVNHMKFPQTMAKPTIQDLLVETATLGRSQAPLPDQLVSTLTSLKLVAPEIDPLVLERAIVATSSAREQGLGRKPIITVIDYGRPASERRLWVFNLSEHKKVFWEYVAHGVGSGGELASRWSNINGSLASSLGLYVTRGTYVGNRGYSLRMIGLDHGFNDQAYRRSIVMHGAYYMTPEFRNKHGGFFGQSHGCPALDLAVAEKVINYVARGSLVFVHWPDAQWLASSRWLQGHVPSELTASPKLVAQSPQSKEIDSVPSGRKPLNGPLPIDSPPEISTLPSL